jgi:serine/threonine protein kinase
MDNKVGWRLGKMLDGRYEMISVLGIGGMAVVYKAFDHKLKRNVAIKVLRDDVAVDSQSRRRFRTEYQAVGMLSHPNIRAVYDVVASGDTEYIVMEYVEGINLKQYLKKKGALAWKETLHFGTQIARALSHAHSKGIIHMDIKPQNIMLPKDGTAKVYTADGKEKASDTVATGDILRVYSGTVLYSSHPVVIYGDVNGDGKVSSIDLRMMQKHILSVVDIEGFSLIAADVNKDKKISSIAVHS